MKHNPLWKNQFSKDAQSKHFNAQTIIDLQLLAHSFQIKNPWAAHATIVQQLKNRRVNSIQLWENELELTVSPERFKVIFVDPRTESHKGQAQTGQLTVELKLRSQIF